MLGRLTLVPDATSIVHIGFPKTASTWFQRSFYPHVRSPAYVDRARVNAAFLKGNALDFDPGTSESIRTAKPVGLVPVRLADRSKRQLARHDMRRPGQPMQPRDLRYF